MSSFGNYFRVTTRTNLSLFSARGSPTASVSPTELPDSLSSDPKFLNLVDTLTRDKVDEFLPVRCPEAAIMKRIEDIITELRDQHDSIGGTVTYIIRGYPSGLGEPCFNKLKALLAHAIMSIPATKGFEISSGFHGAEMRGSVHNDPHHR
ncbi:chorismate synthase [Cordyceps militaris]|uniref:chorismate synthase n=1 Tax=Cordyceps militaris TaxID=73501 RepID=A0A2H4SBN8_CORMI|nr:chorismate synthase [Cordyceps militaris]